LGRHVCGRWSTQAPYEYFVAVVTAANQIPFIDANSLDRYELSLSILFFRDLTGCLVVPMEPVVVGVSRHNLSLCLGTLSHEQIE
jgi:hypothetical protein